MGGEQHKTCPLFFAYDSPVAFNYILRAYNYAEKGILPEPGSLNDQASTLVTALSYVGKAVAEVQDYMMKKGAPGAPDKP